MKRLPLSKLTFMLIMLLSLVLMTAQAASAVSLNDSTWKIVKSPNGSLPQSTLNAMAANSEHDAWAIGDTQCLSDSCSKTLIEHWDGSQWSIVKSPNPGFNQNILNGAVAISTHDAWAVGSFDSNGGSEVKTLVLHWDGSQWSVVKSPNPGTFNFLNTVTAASADDIWAVGNYYIGSGSPSRTLVEHWDGSQWSIIKSPNVGMHDNFLNSVTTVSAKDAWTVGVANDSNNISHALIEHWNGTNWSIFKSPDFGPNGGGFGGVVAVSANNIWAVGGYATNANPNLTLVEHWNGSQWSIIPNPNKETDFFNAVAADSANDVWAGGAYNSTSHPNQTLIEHCC